MWDINPTRPTGERDLVVVKQVNSSALQDRVGFPAVTFPKENPPVTYRLELNNA